MPYFEPLYGKDEQGFDRYLNVHRSRSRQLIQRLPLRDLAERWAALDTDVNFTYPMRVWARHMQTVKSPAFCISLRGIRRFPSATVTNPFMPRKSSIW